MYDNNRGPFRDLSIPAELYVLQGIDDNGRAYRRLRLETATQLFLEVFNPSNGWAVKITSEVMDMDMRPYEQRNNDTSPLFPVVRFVATLHNPAGAAIATASTLWVIKEATAWEKGETNARQRLYASMGLSILRYEDEPPAQTHGQPQVKREENPLGDVRPRPYTGREDVRNTATPATTAPASQQTESQGPDAPDGCDSEGFPGGCERFGHTPDTCPNARQAAATETGAGAENTGGENSTGKRRLRAGATDSPPTPSILRTIRTLCENLGREVPELKTMAEARAFHQSLNGG